MESTMQAPVRTQWEIDPSHTLIEFAVRHLMVSTIKGRFTGVRGTISLDESPDNDSSVEVEIDASTLTSGDAQRDQHLLYAPEFLDVGHYPTITFKSKRIDLHANNHATVTGDFTLHGITNEITLDTRLTGYGKNPFGGNKELVGFEARTSLARAEFGIDFHVPIEGGVMVSDTIEIFISIEATKKE